MNTRRVIIDAYLYEKIEPETYIDSRNLTSETRGSNADDLKTRIEGI